MSCSFDLTLNYLNQESIMIDDVNVVQMGNSKVITYIFDGIVFCAVRFDENSEFIIELQDTTEDTFEAMFASDKETTIYPSFFEWRNKIAEDISGDWEE